MVVFLKNLKKNFLFFILALLFFQNAPTALADSRPDWAAEKYSKISEINLAPGEIKKIKIGFFNRGAYNWRNTGKNYVSIYTYSPKYHASKLAAASWISSSHVVKLKDSLAGPNSKGYFEFEIKAPAKKGVYKETFALAAENKAWIKNGQFELIVNVGMEPDNEKGNIEEETEENAILNPPKIEIAKKDWEAMKLSKLDPLSLHHGEEKNIALLFMNKGKQDWAKRTLILNSVSLAGTNTDSSFAGNGWLDGKTVAEFSDSVVKKGQTEIYQILLQAPSRSGVFTLHFSLLVNGQKVEGGNFDVPITVTSQNPLENTVENTYQIFDDPRVRVGLMTTEEPMEFVSTYEYKIKDNEGLELGRIIPGVQALVAYDEENKKYSVTTAEQKIISEKPVRLEPLDPNAYFTLKNHELLARWGNKVNYNEFRDTLELRLAMTGYVWVINELGMENYLKGMAEESESAHPEFLKAMAVAERSYAYYHLKNPAKHSAGGFTLDADNDQVYRGYMREKISPNAVAAVEATRGMVVTYNGEPADTPYFARSNGKTKSAKAVWGTNKPWLISVATPYDKGKTQWGHGVGMSARDGLYRAKDGANWDDILKYYYTGIDLQKMY